MASPQWDSTSVKAQLRLTSQRLGHLQEKNDSRGSITRADIATLLRQGNVGLARVKAQNLYREDMQGDVFEMLEMHVGVILERISELDHSISPSPAVIEAASSIVYAAPRVESKDLQVVRELLVNRLGPDFARASIGNRDKCVSDRIVKDLSAPPPSAGQLDAYLLNIARTYGVQWQPDPRRQDILVPLSEILDQQSSPVVDVAGLRKLCTRGIPDEPAWLRPRIWRVLLGTLPVLKASWSKEVNKQRESYYDLVRRLLEPFANLPEPTTPLSSLDLSLVKVAKQLSGIPSDLFSGLEEEPESSKLCPLDSLAPEDVKIACADNLNARLQTIQKTRQPDSSPSIPEIRLESDSQDDAASVSSSERSSETTVLHASKAFDAPHAHEKHTSALLRLLYLHSSVNPGNVSPHIPALLLPLYSVLNQEVEPEDLAHVEADTFWLFEAMVGEFSELEDEDGGNLWMRKFSERLNWADADLRDNLFAKGLDPALPHYSYRWLAPLLTQTLPLPSVIVVWDALFACQMRDRQNLKLEFLVDVCTAMLLRARTALLRLGKTGLKSPSLWAEDTAGMPSSPLRPWELGDAFLQGMTLLQHYPIDAAGGIDSVLQTASELRHRREDEAKLAANNPRTLGDRLRLSVWKGFTNQTSSPDRSPSPSEASDDEDTSGNDTETQEVTVDSGLTARLAATVWKGITNQTAMEPPPSPLSPTTPSLSPSRSSPSIVVNDTSEDDAETQYVTNDLTRRLAATVWRGITNQTAMEPPPSPLSPPTPPESPSPSIPDTPLSPSIVVTDSEPSTGSTSKGWPSSTSIWGYAEKLKESNAAATLAKVSSNWQAKALTSSWNIRSGGDAAKLPTHPQSTDALRHSAPPQNYDVKLNEPRRTSVPAPDRSGLYSPPERPAFFKPPRDTMIFSGNGPVVDLPSSPELSPSSEGGIMQKTRSLQASLAALTRGSEPEPAVATPQPKPKSGPRPLLLGSSSLITPRSERFISRSENSTPIDKRNMSGQWNDVMQSRNQDHALNRDSLSSVSSLSPSDALTRGKLDYDSDSPAPASRKVALNRRSISPMAPHARTNSIPHPIPSTNIPPIPHFRSGSTPHLSLSSSSGSSSAALGSPVMSSPLDRSPKSPGWGRVHIPDSPPGADGLPVKSPSLINSIKTTIPEESPFTEALELAPSVDDTPLEPPLPSRKLTRKKTPPPVHNLTGDTSDSSTPEPPKRSIRVRAKRSTRPPNLHLQTTAAEPSTSPSSLAVDWPHDEQELATTPKATSFDANIASSPRSPRRTRKVSTEGRSPTRQRKASGEGQEPRSRKVSTEARIRKTSETKGKKHRDSAADMGDDEGYDELLSAYESEDSAQPVFDAE